MSGYQVLYLLAGALIGILIRRLLFSVKSIGAFSKAVMPAISHLNEYSIALIEFMSQGSLAASNLDEKKAQLESTLAAGRGMYPEWIYRAGFNPGLRAGARAFLIQFERAVELLFAMEFILQSNSSLRANLLNSLTEVMKKNQALVIYLEGYFAGKKMTGSDFNFMSDVTALDGELKQRVPGSLELLDMSPDYMDLIVLVRNAKDLRQVLLGLISALPE